jgi:hypothetical protein
MITQLNTYLNDLIHSSAATTPAPTSLTSPLHKSLFTSSKRDRPTIREVVCHKVLEGCCELDGDDAAWTGRKKRRMLAFSAVRSD